MPKRVEMRRVVQIYGALEFFTDQNGNTPNAPPKLVKGNVGHLLLSFRVATAKKLLQPLMDVYDETRRPVLEQCKIETTERLPEGQFAIDVVKLAKLTEPILQEEVDMPDLKPLTWQLLEKAGVMIDPALVIMLGDFLEGEPAEDEAKPTIHSPVPV